MEHERETAMAELSVQLAMKLVLAQFCRAKENEIINEGAECEPSEDAMQF